MKVSVVGVGYVGLVAAACLAESGNHVICADSDKTRIENLKNNKAGDGEPSNTAMVTL